MSRREFPDGLALPEGLELSSFNLGALREPVIYQPAKSGRIRRSEDEFD